ncbi:MAG: RNA polymerase sigma-54 factor, partial [Bacteroidota bacterium]
MQKLSLNQSLQQKLSPQQIQFIKLLQIPTAELSARVLEELEINPTLEEGKEEPEKDDLLGNEAEENYDEDKEPEEVNIDDYLQDDEISGYKMQGDSGGQEEDKEMPIPMTTTLMDALDRQLGFLKLDERQKIIGQQLIGSIDEDGYIRRDLKAIVNDMAFAQNIETSEEEIEAILFRIQRFDPAGIGARDLQECLLLQLERRLEGETDEVERYYLEKAMEVVDNHFEEFTKKHYQKIKKRL